MAKRYLVLADGTVHEGVAFGADAPCLGELVFTTGMGGYIETLTDPSYYGQIVMMTFPLIGNYGVIEDDFEGECRLKGFVVREWCASPSNFRCQYDLDAFLKARHIPGIAEVDTRLITRSIREKGVMNAMMTDDPSVDLSLISGYAVKDAVAGVTRREAEFYPAPGEARFRVTLIDYGAKRNIIRELLRRGCAVTAVPANASAEDVLSTRPDGVMLSNGPGDPQENTGCIEVIRALMGRIPMFGICLGHQLMALADGGATYKLHYGHRGVNQPVRDLNSPRTYITSQNHGYAVDDTTLSTGVTRYINANDKTCEGVDYPGRMAFSVQFHPEACAGPKDTSFLFDRFVTLMEENRHAAE